MEVAKELVDPRKELVSDVAMEEIVANSETGEVSWDFWPKSWWKIYINNYNKRNNNDSDNQ